MRPRTHRYGALRRGARRLVVRRLTCVRAVGILSVVAFDPRSLDELARRLAEAVPPGLAALRDDLEKNFRSVLQAGLAKLDLVTRQEFDIQAAVLQRSRKRLEELERRIAALEKPPTA